ncbi:unnamed protein product [Trichogramma brassicae]|uniref:Uncharacterized protein n=1 Tax=Trichogramma brassicae TaxID=86971 RepID=A0A6H5J2E2_9HYME|nr:unnamed protein product [Trichogramma brassicae]
MFRARAARASSKSTRIQKKSTWISRKSVVIAFFSAHDRSTWNPCMTHVESLYDPRGIPVRSTRITNPRGLPRERFISLLIEADYKDQLIVDNVSNPSPLRTTPIHLAASNEFLNRNIVIPQLFKIYNSFDVNYADTSGLTHFHVACKFGCEDVVEKFLKAGQDPNQLVPETGDSPLHLALTEGFTTITLMLLKYGADPNFANKDRLTALHVICKKIHDNDFAKLLFEIVDEVQLTLQVDARDKWDRTPLHYALADGCKEQIVQELLSRGADLHSAGPEGLTPLHIICQNNSAGSLMKVFLNMCTLELNARDSRGNTPLHLAVRRENVETVESLLRQGADPNFTDMRGLTALLIICQKPDTDCAMAVKLFEVCEEVGWKIEIDALDKMGNTALHLALYSKHAGLTELLLKNGANPKLSDVEGSTALHIVGKGWGGGARRLAMMLFELTDDRHLPLHVDAPDKFGRTPLQVAMFWSNTKIAKLLLSKGAVVPQKLDEVDASDYLLGWANVHHAVISGDKRETESLLRRPGANPNVCDPLTLRTPLHMVCDRYYDDGMARLLLEIGDDHRRTIIVDALDVWRRTPLYYALQRGHAELAELLIKRGADPKLALQSIRTQSLTFGVPLLLRTPSTAEPPSSPGLGPAAWPPVTLTSVVTSPVTLTYIYT